MTLRARLAVGLAIIAIVLIVPLVIARSAMLDLHAQVVELRDYEVKTSISLASLRDALADVRAREIAIGIVKDERTHRELIESIRNASRSADEVIATLGDSGTPRALRSRIPAPAR